MPRAATKGAADAVHELSRRAPTSIGAALLLGGGALVGMIGVVVPPMYSAYVEAGVRAQVKQVLGAVRGLEEDIESTWFSARLLPRQTDHATLRCACGCRTDRGGARPSAHRARSPGARAGGPGARRQDAPDRARRATLSDRWNWMCVPVDIPRRYLPKECLQLDTRVRIAVAQLAKRPQIAAAAAAA